MELNPTNIDGKEYYTVQEFAVLVGKGVSQIYGLIHKGLLKSETKFNKKFIPASEMEKKDKLFANKHYQYSGAHYE